LKAAGSQSPHHVLTVARLTAPGRRDSIRDEALSDRCLIGLAAGYVLIRLSQRNLLSEELTGETDLEDVVAPGS
jgi:hypothetical protein